MHYCCYKKEEIIQRLIVKYASLNFARQLGQAKTKQDDHVKHLGYGCFGLSKLGKDNFFNSIGFYFNYSLTQFNPMLTRVQ